LFGKTVYCEGAPLGGFKPRPFKAKSPKIKREIAFFRSLLGEGRQLDQVVVGNSFHRVSSLAPGSQATGDDEHLESELL